MAVNSSVPASGHVEILLEGRVFEAAEALAKGLLTRVVPDEALAETVARTMGRLAHGAPLAARLDKYMVARLSAGPQDLTEAELRPLFSYADSRDHRHGVQALLADKEPHFTGD